MLLQRGNYWLFFLGGFFFPLLPWPVMGEFWVLVLLCCDKATCFMLEPLQAAVA